LNEGKSAIEEFARERTGIKLEVIICQLSSYTFSNRIPGIQTPSKVGL
jgi:hypothetical protein